jgi:hypothetical protein
MAVVTKRNALFGFDTLQKAALQKWNGYISAEFTVDPASLATIAIGLGSPATFTVPGARLGDFVMASFSGASSGVVVVGAVSATDTVALAFLNPTAGTLDIGSGTVYLRVYKRVPL